MAEESDDRGMNHASPRLALPGGGPVRRGLTRFARSVAGPVVVLCLAVAVWYLLSTWLLPPHKRFLLPPPHRVVAEGFLVWRTGDRRGLEPILASLWDSTRIALIGLSLTIFLGTLVAVPMSLSRAVEKATWPYLVAVQSAPILALTPLIRALIDGVTVQRVVVVVLVSIFPVVSNTLFGLLQAERGLHDLFTMQRAGTLARLFKLQFPSALPNMFLGYRISAGLSVIGAVVGDFYFRQGGTVGIGAQIDLYRSRLWGPELITAIIMASTLGIMVFAIFGWLSRRILGTWHGPTQARYDGR